MLVMSTFCHFHNTCVHMHLYCTVFACPSSVTSLVQHLKKMEHLQQQLEDEKAKVGGVGCTHVCGALVVWGARMCVGH